MRLRHLLSTLCFGSVALVAAAIAAAQPPAGEDTVFALYPTGTLVSLGVPEIREPMGGSSGVFIRNVSEPTVELFLPAPGRANGTAVIVAPGGGFVGIDYSAGGTEVARLLAQRGITALVLKYRTIRSASDPMQMPEVHVKEMKALVSRKTSGLPVEIPRFAGERHAIEDAGRAVKLVRQRAREWQIDPARIGFLGFSAGAFIGAELAIGDKALRPDFVALLYGGLRTPVPADAPPAFIAGAADDDYLPNDPVQLYTAWRDAGVAAELHVYERGGHGFNIKPQGYTSDRWFEDLSMWLQSRKLMLPARASHGNRGRQP